MNSSAGRRWDRYYALRYRLVAILVAFTVLNAHAGGAAETPQPCSEAWNRYVEQKLVSGDGQGHGPDLGSDEWKGVVEFKLGVRGQANVPPRDTGDWCRFIDRLVRER